MSQRLEAYVRRSLERDDYEASVRDAATPAWERALAHVLVLQDLVRRLDDRRRDGQIRGWEGDDISGERRQYLEALKQTELGYRHDPSWTNGGLGSHGADPVPDDPTKRDLKPALRRLAVYGRVLEVDGEPELAWQYGAAAFELGVSSTHDAMVSRMLLGAAMGSASFDSPEGPTEDQIHAANVARTVRTRLAAIPARHQGTLELAYTDRRYELHLVSDYGVGLAPLVWRARQRVTLAHGRLPPEMRDKLVLTDLVADVRRDIPYYAPHGRSPKQRIKNAAEQLLGLAHAAYRGAIDVEPPSPPRRRRRRKPEFVAAGTRGKKSRQLVEDPGRAA